ncbi:MAG: cysteine desulfurase [Chlamydiota bacterium]|nr:cysteine desulfurase [Chlamydiota bacterium]
MRGSMQNSLNTSNINVEQIRKDFPVLQQNIYGKSLKYFDNAASTQKPQIVIDAVNNYYSTYYANIHRGAYKFSEDATLAYEECREKVASFIHAGKSSEIVFVRGATEAINLVASSFGEIRLLPGDEIIISEMEHHSNIVPWQILCQKKQALLRVIPMNDHGELLLDRYDLLISPKTKLVALTHISNALGTINPIKQMIDTAHDRNIPVLIDGAQAIAHQKVDVQALDCDFYVFSGHKICGPTGIGVLYAKEQWLEEMPPYHGGGDMIVSVTFEGTTYKEPPYKFEAGTPNIAGAIGLSAALDYLENLGLENIAVYEKTLLDFAVSELSQIPGLTFIGTAENRISLVSFILDRVHPHDIATFMNQEGIAIRTGHHCAQPVMKHFNIPATARVSFSFYNTVQEIERLKPVLVHIQEFFKP